MLDMSLMAIEAHEINKIAACIYCKDERGDYKKYGLVIRSRATVIGGSVPFALVTAEDFIEAPNGDITIGVDRIEIYPDAEQGEHWYEVKITREVE